MHSIQINVNGLGLGAGPAMVVVVKWQEPRQQDRTLKVAAAAWNPADWVRG